MSVTRIARRGLLVFEGDHTRRTTFIIHGEVEEEGPLKAPVFLRNLGILSLFLTRPARTLNRATPNLLVHILPLALCRVYVELDLARRCSIPCCVRTLIISKGGRSVLELLVGGICGSLYVLLRRL